MLKRNITYTDFNDQVVTEEFYFNISRAELVEMQVSELEGLQATIQRIIASNDMKSLIQEFKNLILKSVGEKSIDGKRFIKTDEVRQNFEHSAAYDSLFMELATNETAAALFIKGILPSDMVQQIEQMTQQDKPKGPPPQPPMPPKAV